MLDAIQLLMDEHRRIEGVLDALEKFISQVEVGQLEDGRLDLGKFAEFISEFADRIHHGKEEEILFAEMMKAGFPREEGPLAIMYLEHEQGRRHVRAMRGYAKKGEPWSDADREEISAHARAFMMLLRQHIQKEDRVLYPLAQQRLSAEALKRVAQKCEEFAKAEKRSEELPKLAEELRQRY